MVKPACAMTKSKIVAVCATPTTLTSKRYAELKTEFGEGVQFIEPYCGDWAQMIESNTVDQQKVTSTINDVCIQGADVIVLGCTHYHWIGDTIKVATEGRAVVIQPEDAIVERVKNVLGM
jgi:glutamate racemase